ncbi:MAG: hypothetical protein M3O36_21030, partial [Myxococcota bacterium]|nr:hypothetical protein [Myxococcota bacterium]
MLSTFWLCAVSAAVAGAVVTDVRAQARVRPNAPSFPTPAAASGSAPPAGQAASDAGTSGARPGAKTGDTQGLTQFEPGV